MTNSKTPFYKVGMASTPLYQEKKDDYNAITGEKITSESSSSIKTTINGRKGTLTTNRRNFETPGSAKPDGGKEQMSDTDWKAYTRANPDWNKGSNRAAKKEKFTPDMESPMELPKLARTTFDNGLTGQPIKPIPIPVDTGGTGETSFGGENKARFGEEKEGGGNLFKTTSSKKMGCPGGCP